MKGSFFLTLTLITTLPGLLLAYDCSSSIQEIISYNEGSRQCVYTDSLGHPTIGIGFNLDKSGASDELAQLGLDYDSVRSGATCLNEDQITSLFNTDLDSATDGVRGCVSTFDDLPDCIQKVLLDMTFNMGPSSLCGWPNLITQLNNQDYQGAANNLRSSKWCGQVGSRCTRDVSLMENSNGSFLAQ